MRMHDFFSRFHRHHEFHGQAARPQGHGGHYGRGEHHASHFWQRHGEGHHGQDFHFTGRGAGGGRHGSDFFNGRDGLRGGGARRGGGRMFGHGDLKLLLLALIEQQPRHGYELIRIIEDMFQGHYSPSPGAIYPTLTMLEEMGHARIESEDGGRKLYAITEQGRTYLDENRAAVDAVTARTRESARDAARMAMPQAIHKAMHAIRHAMLMHGMDGSSKAEVQRVAAILERAASEIAAGPRGG